MSGGRALGDGETQSLAFVLAGGASAGAYQAGMLRALLDAGIRPDLVVGTSVGALNAAMFAADPTPSGLDRLDAAWSGVSRRDVFPIRPLTLALGVLGRRDHLVSNRALASWAGERLGIVRLEQADLPLHVVATALDSGEPVVLSNGPALTALLASCAIPGLLPPVERDGQLLIDGAVASDCPLPEARGLGATEAIVLPSFTRGAVDTRRRTAGALGLFAYEQVFAHWTADRSEAGMRVRVVPLPLRDGHGPLDFSRGAHRIEAAYAMTTRWLAGEEAGAAAA